MKQTRITTPMLALLIIAAAVGCDKNPVARVEPSPVAPSGLLATAAGSRQVQLQWTDNASGMAEFEVERCAGAGCTQFGVVATVTRGVASHGDTGLLANTRYQYRVRAVSLAGASSYSNVASATTRQAEPVWSSAVQFGHSDARISRGDRLYRVYRAAPGGPIQVQSSADEGATWSAPLNTGIARAIPLYGTFRAVGQVLHLLTQDAGDDLYYHRSPDGGVTWSPQVRLSWDANQKAHRAWLEVKGQYVHVLNTRPFNANPHQTTYWRSVNSGASFEAPVVLADASVRSSSAALATDGNIVYAAYEWRQEDNGVGGIYLQRSADNGASWSVREVLHPGPAHRPRVLAQQPGGVLVTWSTWAGPVGSLEFSEARLSTDHGLRFGDRINALRNPSKSLGHPAWASGPVPKMVHVIAYDSDAPDPARYAYSLDWGATWSESEVVPGSGRHPYDVETTDGYVHFILGVPFSANPVYYVRRVLTP